MTARATGGDAPSVRAFSPDEWPVYRDLRLRALADSPDAFGSTFASEAGHGDDDWARRLGASADARANRALVAEVRGESVGLAWARIEAADPTVAALYQMWVAPDHRDAGAGRMLLDAVVAWARARGASALELGVTCGDSAARRLYERAGFAPVGDPHPLRPGSTLLAQSMRLALGGAAEGEPMETDTPGAVRGGCLCGTVRFVVATPTLFCGHCHCSMCRRNHGAAFVTWFAVPRSQVSVERGSEELVRYASSEHGSRSFCRRCGSSLFCVSSRHPDVVDVPLASMDGPIDRLPEAHIYFDDRAAWTIVADDLPRLGGPSGLEPLK